MTERDWIIFRMSDSELLLAWKLGFFIPLIGELRTIGARQRWIVESELDAMSVQTSAAWSLAIRAAG